MPASPQTPQMAVAMPMPQTAARPAPRERATAIRAVIRKFGPGETAATSHTEATASRCESMMRIPGEATMLSQTSPKWLGLNPALTRPTS